MLVMDFQPAIVGSLPDADALLDRTADTIAAVRAKGGTIGYVRVAFEDADYAAIPETNKAFSQLGKARVLQSDDAVSAVHEKLTPQSGDIVVRKVRIGGMSTTDLDQQLRERGIDTLVLSGVATSGVVLSTLTDAADKDYRLFVLSDGVADSDPEVHDVLVNKVFARSAYVIDTAEFRSLLSA
nr:cysteine hydrolase [Actinopolymorpha pittospori]